MFDSKWTNKWKNVLIWASGYLSFIAYALVGGYVIVKDNDEELKKTAKLTFVVTLIFTALSAFLGIFDGFASLSSSYYSSFAYDFYKIFNRLVSIAKIVVYAVFIIMALLKKEESDTDDKKSADKVEEK